ncbi:MAG TPA: MFS transporter [Gaiellaceae bacterium]|nr:MFS transporter [Gaiellaceae bacterium]
MTATALSAPALREGHPLRWRILAVILCVEVMDLLDGTIVNVALPTIRSDLHASLTALQWVAGGYALTFAVGLVTGGRLGDIFGRRRMFLLGVAGFTVASALCGLAWSPGVLIGLRLVQGVFAASMIPQGFGIVKQVFPEDEIGKAFGMFGPVIGGSAVLGPVIGGLLVDWDLLGTTWRLIFLINVPVGLAGLIGGLRLLPESRAAVRPTLDLKGAALVSAGIGLLVYPLIQGRTLGWPAWTYAMLGAGVLLLAAFAVFELRRERRGRSALVTMSLFSRRAYSAGLVTILLFFAGMIGVMFTFSIYLQIGFGYSAIAAGLAFIPWSLGTAVGAGVGSGVFVPKFGRHALHGALAVMAVGIAGMAAVVAHDSHHISILALAGPELVAGIGMGAGLAPLFSFILAGVADDEVGSASGVLNAVQQLAAALGIALIGTLFFSVAAHHGLATAFGKALWIEIASLAGCALFVLLLPMHPREGDAF